MTHADVIADLREVFTAEKLTVTQTRIYIWALQDLPVEVLDKAVKEIVLTRKSRYFPTIGEIRSLAVEISLQLPSETEALAQIDARLVWGRGSRDAQERPYAHPLVLEAIRVTGGFYALREAEKPSVVRAQFLQAYRDICARATRDVQTAPALSQAPVRGVLDK